MVLVYLIISSHFNTYLTAIFKSEMDFKVPEEYADFVSSAEELLAQFQSAGESRDILEYQIYTDEEMGVEALLSLREEILSFIHLTLLIPDQPYIWHQQAFNLTVAFHSKCLFGSISVEDSVEDEWLVCYLLFKVSSQFPELSISIRDGDGQFLLIEAADYLPEWISPDNSLHRVWIRQEKLHIVPFDEPGRLKEGGIELKAALRAIREGEESVADTAVQRCIQNRIADYPMRSYALMHSSTCILPIEVANLLKSHPQLISYAIAGLNASRHDGLKYSKQLTRFKSADFVVSEVKFSRALYAQLLFYQNFKLPSEFGSVASNYSGKLSSSFRKGLDIGGRIAVGFEVSYHMSKQAGHDVDWELLKDIESVFPDGKLRHLYDNFALRHDVTRINNIPFSHLVDNVTEFDAKHFVSLTDFYVCDSDDWLYLTPEEFDSELRARIQRSSTNNSGNPVRNKSKELPAEAKLAKDTADLDDVIRGVESFFFEKSGVDGVDSSSHRPETREGGLEIDMNKVLSLLQKNALDKDDTKEESLSDNSSNISEDSFDDDEAYCFESNFGSLLDNDQLESEEGNSLDEKNYDNSFFNEYAASMEKELMETSLFDTFEREVREDGSLGGVDMHLNLIKNLLEASAQNPGAPGPVESLLRQLGVQLPSPPKADS